MNLTLNARNKSTIHQAIQKKIKHNFPKNTCSLEVHFPQINRIADVVYHPSKLIFEVQYSLISLKELQHRQLDYNSIGYQVIWILHDTSFHHIKLLPVENYLQHFPHYFTNINSEGKGIIYDQPALIKLKQRKQNLKKQEVSFYPPLVLKKREYKKLPPFLKKRLKFFKFYLLHDYTDIYLNHPNIVDDINFSFPYNDFILNNSFFQKITKSYSVLFQFFLKKTFF
jgi:competence protein CoiA